MKRKVVVFMKHYEGSLGKFDYDEKQFRVDDRVLHYIGKETDGSKVIIPIGLNSLAWTFAKSNLVTPPVMPDGVTNCYNAFRECKQLLKAPNIPASVTECTFMFYNCFRLKEATVCIPNKNRICRSMYCGCVSLENVDSLECSDLTTGKYLDCFSLKLSKSQLAQLRSRDLLNSKVFVSTFPNCTSLLEKCFVSAFPFHGLITIGVATRELGKSRKELVEKWIMPFVMHGILPNFSVDYFVSGIDEVSHYIVGDTKECSIPNPRLTEELFKQQLGGYKRTA